MTIQPTNVNAATPATKETAPIKNVALALSVVRSLQARNPLQPNLGVFSGFFRLRQVRCRALLPEQDQCCLCRGA